LFVQENSEFLDMNRHRVKPVGGFAVAIALTATAIALWGFAHRLYATLLPGLGAAFALSPAQSDMARSAIAIGYLVMTLPTAFVSRNLGYKIGMLFGLGTFAVGMFLVYPAVERHSLFFFLVSASVIGSGLAILEVTAVPLVVFIGRAESAIQRTVMAVSLSPFGALAALYLGPKILAGSTSPDSLVTLFSAVGIAAIALAFVMEMVPFPAVAEARAAPGDRTLASFRPPLRLKRFRYAVAAAFLSLFAQIIIAGFAPAYSRSVMPSLTPAAAQLVLVWAYLALGIGRLVGPLVMAWVAPMRLLVVFAAASTVCALASAVASGPLAIAGLVGTCFFMAILFPTIFADTLLDLGDMAKSGTAILMFVAFSGTGLFALMAVVSTTAILPWIMILPAACFAGVLAISIALQNTRRSASGSGSTGLQSKK
jgi:FHS family L-fucose permease-like MFS transporter